MDGDIKLAKPSYFKFKKLEVIELKKYEKLAKNIIKNIGGKDNISSLSHCITRLRFKLKDEGKANDDVIKDMDGVVTVMHSAGQYQVVIGNHVSIVYEEICKAAGINSETDNKEEEAPKGIFNIFVDIIAGCFQPIIGPICAAGMIKGLNALLIILGFYNTSDGTYIILNSIGDSVFYFMPVLIGYTSAKKFNLQPVVGMIIGCILCYPSIQNAALSANNVLGVIFESNYYTTFFRVPFLSGDYTSSVVHIIFVNCIAGKIEKVSKKLIPEMLQSFFVPFFILLISVPIGLIVIAPLVSLVIGIIINGYSIVYKFSPILVCAIIGFSWQLLVIYGVHWVVKPFALINIAIAGFDTIMVGTFGASFAQTAAVIAMYFKNKDKNMKNLYVSSIISGICGVTESCIYGITLKKKKPFIYSLIGAAVGGAVMGAMDVKMHIFGGLGIFGVVNYIDGSTGDARGLIAAFICIIVSMLVTFLLTLFFWKEKDISVNNIEDTSNKEVILAPLCGEVIELGEVRDEAFSQGLLGKGVAIKPKEGKVVSPCNGNITTLFPTLHAIGITSESGVEILIHVGLNTVELNGIGFVAYVKQGDNVTAGQTLVSFDKDMLESEGYVLDTPVVITNSHEYFDVIETNKNEVNSKDKLITVLF